jgi:hypothetical protein
LDYLAVDVINLTRPFVQPDLKVGAVCGGAEIHGAPFNVEDAVRRRPASRSKDTTYSARIGRAASVYTGMQVVPVRRSQIVHGGGGQASVSECGVAAGKLQVAV